LFQRIEPNDALPDDNLLWFDIGLALGLAFGSASISRAAPAAQAQDLQNTIYLDTKDGRITILLRPISPLNM